MKRGEKPFGNIPLNLDRVIATNPGEEKVQELSAKKFGVGE